MRFTKNLEYWEEFVKPTLRNPNLINISFYKENPKSMTNVFEKFKLNNFSKLKKIIQKLRKNI